MSRNSAASRTSGGDQGEVREQSASLEFDQRRSVERASVRRSVERESVRSTASTSVPVATAVPYSNPRGSYGGPQGEEEEEGVTSPIAYRRLLRKASSYASFQLPRQHALDDSGKCGKTCYSGKPVVCILIILVCTAMMITELVRNNEKRDRFIEDFSRNPMFGPDPSVLLELGAKRGDLIVKQGEWYRLIAPIFLHGGLLHFAFNMMGLYSIGFPLEKQFGSPPVLYIFLLSGIMGVVLSSIFNPAILGVGASGGIFGIFGSAWSELLQNWSLYQGQGCRSLIQLSVVTAFNLVLGLMPFLDNFAHLGGFITGFLAGFSVLVSNRYSYFGELKKRKTYQIALQTCSVVVTPIFVVVGLFILYFGVGADQSANDWCPGCKYLSCVPFPPGDNPWWTCDPCVDAGTVAYPNASDAKVGIITCPTGVNRSYAVTSVGQVDEQFVLEVCRKFCS